MNAIVKIENQTPFIEVELNGKVQLGVNARDLHKMLEVKTDFSDWIKRRIKQCGFEENFDFIKLLKKEELSKTGQNLIEYIISVDMTKHLGMMERNKKGHEIRKYYIEQEELARQLKDGLQVRIGKLSAQIDLITKSLSEAASFLAVNGKKTKPAMLKELDDLINEAQPSLDLKIKDEDNS
ncbi:MULTISPECIES: antA/AntB antirepressor family protein [Acinetobacter calcoaceticus/baumannii complex]|uniref:antA/AntB antirepressor family protein n=1 Tax=Acinetobacter calcoaceticus/baumannii complex TaxID=909768 RepID=UPI000D65DE95|nr:MULTISPECIES: antA/AntB antirepressor family protein [Acinetobacter calcoaceticus/baumannii complex]MBD0482806.1 antA/AntB antirepressor family protein [Acinetobacter baumannii]MBF1882354.1 antA/AntB antirepressor family protein [Acinetobacter baumannii]MCT9282830.1 antA/AntB antirepressor family protein [Acinetobacter baumannii]MDA5696463.1 antA/AntB antirepressor family protein [Acinetobacter baumannii]MDB0300229.1 phage antirepressor Ant [Acinetobacter baumannii]